MNSSQIQDFSIQFTNRIKNAIESNTLNNLTSTSLIADISNPSFNIFHLLIPTSAYAAIGGVQAYELDFKLYKKRGNNLNATDPKNYIIDYQFTFEDSYAADFGDINFGVKGAVPSLNSFFTLQHKYGYHPYITRISIRKSYTFE